MASNHCDHKGKGIPLFRKIVRENQQQQEVEEEEVLRTPVTHHRRHQPQTPVADTADCHNNNNTYGNSNSNSSIDGHNSSASTIDSSPTLTPREPMDRPTLLVLPDLFDPNFPSPHQEGQTKSIENTNNNNIPFSPRLAPRQAADRPPPVAHVSVPAKFFFLLPASEGLDSSPNRILRPPPRAGEWDDATIESRILQDNNDDDDNNNNNNNDDDNNSNNNDDDDDPEAAETETELDQARKLRTQSRQQFQQQLQREKAAAQASAIMKPWIERATRLALLQNRVCGNLQETDASGTRTPVPQQKHDRSNNKNNNYNNSSSSNSSTQGIGNGAPLLFQRQRKTALAVNFRPRPEGGLHHNRALLASLEKGRDPKTKTASIEAGAAVVCNANAKTQQEQQQRSAPRIVKWHMVR